MTDLLDRLLEEAAQQRAWQRRHRTRRMLAASLRGYFWMPCPMCGEEFGGYEWVGRISLPAEGQGMTQGICPACELDLGLQALAMCERDGHQPMSVLNEASATSRGGGSFEISLSVNLNATPLRVYCQACGLDLPLDT